MASGRYLRPTCRRIEVAADIMESSTVDFTFHAELDDGWEDSKPSIIWE